jgi:hypothetical protein
MRNFSLLAEAANACCDGERRIVWIESSAVFRQQLIREMCWQVALVGVHEQSFDRYGCQALNHGWSCPKLKVHEPLSSRDKLISFNCPSPTSTDISPLTTNSEGKRISAIKLPQQRDGHCLAKKRLRIRKREALELIELMST